MADATCTSSATCGTCSGIGWPGAYDPKQFFYNTAFEGVAGEPIGFPKFEETPSGLRPDTVLGGGIAYGGGVGAVSMEHNDIFQILQNFQRADGTEISDPDVTPWGVVYLTDVFPGSGPVPIVTPVLSTFRQIDTTNTPLNFILQVLPFADRFGMVMLPIIPLLAAAAPFLNQWVNTASDQTNACATGFGITPSLWGFVPMSTSGVRSTNAFGIKESNDNLGIGSINGNLVIVNNFDGGAYPTTSSGGFNHAVTVLPMVATQEIQKSTNTAWTVMTHTNEDYTSWAWNNVSVPTNPPVGTSPLGKWGNTSESSAFTYSYLAILNYMSTAVFIKFNQLQFITYSNDTGLGINWNGALSYWAQWGDGIPSHIGCIEDHTGNNAIPFATSVRCFQGLYPDTCYGVEFFPYDMVSGTPLTKLKPMKFTFFMPVRFWAVPITYTLTSRENIPTGYQITGEGAPMTMLVTARPTTTGGANVYFYTTLSSTPPETASEQTTSQKIASESIAAGLSLATTIGIVLGSIAGLMLIVLLVGVGIKYHRGKSVIKVTNITNKGVAAPAMPAPTAPLMPAPTAPLMPMPTAPPAPIPMPVIGAGAGAVAKPNGGAGAGAGAGGN